MHAEAMLDTPCAAASLLGGGGGDDHVLERRHATCHLIPLLLDAPSVDDEAHVVDGDGSLRDVGGEHHLDHVAVRREWSSPTAAVPQLEGIETAGPSARRWSVEDTSLLVGRQPPVEL